jgi:hypothetical protein
MALVPCPECGNENSAIATVCPKCGHPLAPAEAYARNPKEDRENDNNGIPLSLYPEQQRVTTQQTTRNEKVNRKTKVIVGSLLALVLVAAGLSAGYYMRSRSSVATVPQPSPSSSIVEAASDAAATRSSDWKFPTSEMVSKEINGKTFYVVEGAFFASAFTYKGLESTLVVISDKARAYIEFSSEDPKLMASVVFRAVLQPAENIPFPEVRTWEGMTVYVFKTRSGKLAGVVPLEDGKFVVVLLPM